MPANAGDLGSILGSERSTGEGHGKPLLYSCLKNPTDREAWRATAHGVTESDTAEYTRTAQWQSLMWGSEESRSISQDVS